MAQIPKGMLGKDQKMNQSVGTVPLLYFLWIFFFFKGTSSFWVVVITFSLFLR